MNSKRFSVKELNTWHINPVINPRTGRKIKKDGPTYKLLSTAFNNMQTGGSKYNIGLASYLPKNEDRFIIQQNNGFLWASIFDGHGGKQVSSFLAKNAVRIYKKISSSSVSMEEALRQTYELLEHIIKQNNIPSGSTGSTLLLHPTKKQLYIAHIGDSRIIGLKGNQAMALTVDHKPSQIDEYKRIKKTGDSIVHHGVWRVGSLAVSRVFGDNNIKRKHTGVIATPDIITMNMNGFSYFVLASDGLFDVCDNDEIFQFILTHIKQKLNKVARELVHYARQKGSTDDITILIIKL